MKKTAAEKLIGADVFVFEDNEAAYAEAIGKIVRFAIFEDLDDGLVLVSCEAGWEEAGERWYPLQLVLLAEDDGREITLSEALADEVYRPPRRLD